MTVFLLGSCAQAVVSAAFESGLAISYMATMAASVFGGQCGSTPHGLSTFERLEQDTLVPPLASQVQRGRLSLVCCERAISSLMGALDCSDVLSKPVGREEAPAIQGQGTPTDSTKEDEEAAMMRRFGAV
jgi:hypothetical protein